MPGDLQSRAPEEVHSQQVLHQQQQVQRGDQLQSEDDCSAGALHVDGRRIHLHLEEGNETLLSDGARNI